MFGRNKKVTDEPQTVTSRVRLGDVADPNRHMTTLVDKPDTYTALDHAPATLPVDRAAALEYLVARVRAALAAGALDDEVADWLDGHIDAMRAGWDKAVDAESEQRKATLLSLLGMELHNLTETGKRVTVLRGQVAELSADVDAWRGVLLGADTFQPALLTSDEQPVAPKPVLLTSALDTSAEFLNDTDLAALAAFDSTLVYAPKES